MSIVEWEEKHLEAMATAHKRPHSPDEQSASAINKHQQNNGDNDKIQLFDIPWEDVLIPKVSCYLSVKDLFKLRVVSRTAKRFAEQALCMLKELDLSFFSATNHITTAFEVLVKNCRHLERLQLLRCHWLTDQLLIELLRNNTRLRELNLSDCLNITANSIQPVIVNCKELNKLELANCHWLTTGAVEALTLHHSNLEYIDLSGCIAVTERSLMLLFKKQSKLATLSLENVTGVTDQVLFNIAKCCPLIEILNLKNCTGITDAGIEAISANCKHLHSLFIKGCSRVNELTLAPLRRRIYIDRAAGGDFHHYRFYPNDFLIY